MPQVLAYGRQSINEGDIEAVCNVLRSDYLTGGPKVEEFEERFAEKVGARHAVAVNSATSALHLAMLAAGTGRGDRVITSPNTFLASANCAAFVGATPDFADIDPVSYNLDPASLERTWTPDVKAVVAVDYAGQPCEMPSIARLAREHGAIVIEDACHGVGGGFVHDGRTWKLGGHPWADMTIFSFHPVKTMTTGEGGMLVTDNEVWAERARRLRSHGIVRQPSLFQGLGPDAGSQPLGAAKRSEDGSTPMNHEQPLNPQLAERGPWYYEMQDLGYNYRITDIQCALGLAQLKRLDQFVARRREIVRQYNEAFASLPWLRTPGLARPENRDLTSWHLYTVQIDFTSIGKTRTEVMSGLKRRGVGTQVLYIPVYLQPWYRQTYGYKPGKCPKAEEYYQRALSLPLYPAMSDADVERVITATRGIRA